MGFWGNIYRKPSTVPLPGWAFRWIFPESNPLKSSTLHMKSQVFPVFLWFFQWNHWSSYGFPSSSVLWSLSDRLFPTRGPKASATMYRRSVVMPCFESTESWRTGWNEHFWNWKAPDDHEILGKIWGRYGKMWGRCGKIWEDVGKIWEDDSINHGNGLASDWHSYRML